MCIRNLVNTSFTFEKMQARLVFDFGYGKRSNKYAGAAIGLDANIFTENLIKEVYTPADLC